MENKNFLTNEELLKLEFENLKLQYLQSKIESKIKDIEKSNMTINNYQILIQNLNLKIKNIMIEKKEMDQEVINRKELRNKFVMELAKKYKIEYSKFGYDDETGEVLEFQDDKDNKEG